MHLKHAVAISLTRKKIQTISNRYTPEACCGDIVDMKKNPWKKNRHTPEACWRCRWAVWRGWPQETCRCFWGTRRAPRLLLDTCRKAKIKTQGFKKKSLAVVNYVLTRLCQGQKDSKKSLAVVNYILTRLCQGHVVAFEVYQSVYHVHLEYYTIPARRKKKNWGTNVTM